MKRMWLVGMSGPHSLDNLKELIEPVCQFFDGIVWTLHDSRVSPEEVYLESVKGQGRIIHWYYCQRHFASRNNYLWCGPIQDGDWCCQIDDLERLNKEFATGLRDFVKLLQVNGYNLASFHQKPFLFEYHESLEYVGTPHESLVRHDGKGRWVELKDMYPNEADVRLNVRPQKRDIPFPYAWVSHYAKYMLGPWGSNAALLGLDTYGNPATLFSPREARRLAFRAEMLKRDFTLTLEGLRLMLSGPIDQTLKDLINGDKVWADFYQHEILGNKAVVHSHLPKDMILIP